MQASLSETMSRNSWLGNGGGGGNEFYMMMMFDNDPSGEGETSSSDAEKRWMLVVVVVLAKPKYADDVELILLCYVHECYTLFKIINI